MERRAFITGVGTGMSMIAAGCTSSLGGGDGNGNGDGDRSRQSVVVVESFFEATINGNYEEANSYLHSDSSFSVNDEYDFTAAEAEHRTVGEFVDQTGDEEGEERERAIQNLKDSLSDLRDEAGYEETDLVFIEITAQREDEESQTQSGYLIVGNTGDEWLIWDTLQRL